MKREHFVEVVEDALDSLPQEFRSRIQNVAVLVEMCRRTSHLRSQGSKGDCFWGSFMACPPPRRAYLTCRADPITLFFNQNIEAVCSSEAEVREQIRLTVIHELGHYFGLDEEQLKEEV